MVFYTQGSYATELVVPRINLRSTLSPAHSSLTMVCNKGNPSQTRVSMGRNERTYQEYGT